MADCYTCYSSINCTKCRTLFLSSDHSGCLNSCDNDPCFDFNICILYFVLFKKKNCKNKLYISVQIPHLEINNAYLQAVIYLIVIFV